SFIGSTALWPGTDVRVELNGVDGTAINVGERMTNWKFRDTRPEDEAVLAVGRAGDGTGATGAADIDFNGHPHLTARLVRAIRTGGDPFVTAQSARHTMEICLAMYKSAKTRQPVELPLADESGIFD